MVLLDNAVEILRLVSFDVQASMFVDVANGSGVGATFVDGARALRRLH